MSPKPTRIAVAVIERPAGEMKREILAGVRPVGTSLAGYWEFPGGKLNATESFEQAVVRECREETGLTVDVVDEFPGVTFDYDHDLVQIRFFRCVVAETISEAEPKRAADSRFKWIEKTRLSEYRFPEANDALIQQLLAEAEC